MADPARHGTWLDRAVAFLAPRAGVRRIRARLAFEMLSRHYEAASLGRRTQGWNRAGGDANAVMGTSLATLRNVARDLVRNNGNAKSALRTICNHVVGWGIVAKPKKKNVKVTELWKQWAETTACDSDGRNNFYGLQKLVMRTVAESGECLIRRRIRFPEDGLPIPMQIQVLDPDYIDTSKNQTVTGRNRDGRQITVGRIVHGVEFDVLGRRSAYWLFSEHPGAEISTGRQSFRVPAESVQHVFYQERPGQARGPSWFAPVLLRFKDFDEYEDATLMKQKIAACLAVITTDTDGTAAPLGTADNTVTPGVDSLEPGMIINAPAGRSITTVDPPTVREYADYTKTTLRAIATGLGVTYEDLTGDYTGMPFSAARMSRLSHWDRVEDWRWQMLIPQFCDPVWQWAMQLVVVMGDAEEIPAARWTAPPAAMIDPQNEGLAYQRNIRTGLQSLPEVLRERGYDPEEVLAEIAATNKLLDRLGLILDSDPRRTTQAGNAFVTAATLAAPSDEPNEEEQPNGGDEGDAAEPRARPRGRASRGRGRKARAEA
jgi:lambda family phage portal protein